MAENQKKNCILFGFGRMGKIHSNLIMEFANLMYIVEQRFGQEDFENDKDYQDKKAKGVKFVKSVVDVQENDIKQLHSAIIVTHADTHLELVQWAYSKKLAIFCEKPLSANFKDSMKILKLSDENPNIPFQVGHQIRFKPNFRKLMESGTEAVSVACSWRDKNPPSKEQLKNLGGIFVDMGCHVVDFFTAITKSDIKKYVCNGSKFYFGQDFCDCNEGKMLVESFDGHIGCLTVGRYSGGEFELKAEASCKNMYVETEKQVIDYSVCSPSLPEFAVGSMDGLRAQFDFFLNRLTGSNEAQIKQLKKEKNYADAYDAHKSTIMSMLAQASYDQNSKNITLSKPEDYFNEDAINKIIAGK